MAVPKKKTSKARRDRRRSHHHIRVKALSVCPHCGSPMIPHRACFSCGWYKGRQVVEVEEV